MDITQERYEMQPYLSKSYSRTKIFRQNQIMSLLGFESSKLEKARVLEIGCSYGGNIIGDAVYNPDIEFVGIDISKNHIDSGNEMISEIGLENIKLYQRNILEYNGEFGKFDYIICHGVFSWVSNDVKDKILETIKNSLVENGSAVISYNVYPAWKNLDILRDIMLFRIKMLKKQGVEINSENEVKYGRGALEFLEKNAVRNPRLQNDAKFFSEKESYYLYHELLEENNTPMYIYQFNEMLKKHDLVHLSDTDLSISNRFLESNELLENIFQESGENHIVKEQYFDLIFNTGFRYSIVVHKEKINNKKLNTLEVLKSLNLRGFYEFDEKHKKYLYADRMILEKINPIIEILNKIYPQTIKGSEIIEKLGDEVKNSLLTMVRENIIEISSFELKDNIDIRKVKLSDRALKYYKVALKNIDKILASSIDGNNYDDIILQLLLLFDGTRSNEEIKEIISKNGFDENIDNLFEKVFKEIIKNKQYEEV